MQVEGAAFAIVGALEAFPRRLAARAIAAHGGSLQRSLSRKTKFAVLGRRMLNAWTAPKIAHRIEQARKAGAEPISEGAFLRLLGLAPQPEAARQILARKLSEQSGLDADIFDRLRLFDAFEFAEEPFGFRDLVAAKQYARLIGDGLDWLGLVRAIRSGRAGSLGGSLANVRLERSSWNDVLMRDGPALTELSGQHLLALPSEDMRPPTIFSMTRRRRGSEDWQRARALYAKAHAVEPSDPVIAFNLSHVLMELGEWQEARRYLTKVLALDPNYAEAWYNLASIARDQNDIDAARRYLSKAVAADPIYPDPSTISRSWSSIQALTARRQNSGKNTASSIPIPIGDKAKQGLQLIGLMANQPGAKVDRKAAEQLHVGR